MRAARSDEIAFRVEREDNVLVLCPKVVVLRKDELHKFERHAGGVIPALIGHNSFLSVGSAIPTVTEGRASQIVPAGGLAHDRSCSCRSYTARPFAAHHNPMVKKRFNLAHAISCIEQRGNTMTLLYITSVALFFSAGVLLGAALSSSTVARLQRELRGTEGLLTDATPARGPDGRFIKRPK